MAALAVGVLATPAGAASAPAGLGPWRMVPGPAGPAADSANLTALAMASPSQGWAAGFTLTNSSQNASFEPLLAAWNGHQWRAVSLGKTTGAGRLDGLAVRSSTDAWAVGTAYPGSSTMQPLILHWNGRQWARMPGAGVPGFADVSLLGVAVHSATDAWAVGEAQPGATSGLRPVMAVIGG
jgi:hypothetical protein